ncbi:MAG TPA: family 1 encapsulin nanocompartment shell protein [Actinocrinis sp.]|uniref:family 1 encapsulin nanocompartment shell protein n=1 Tax=Actinocrinis sp. TaxID=1920516 RepID=UPI002DDCB30E|nr:family 1 encapsulin nanocompartment shell protein [Actinocrinis sp.]HEV3174083.1 family 1 encapsulin nanocompartment shell protein [Actinocrinis sp.]
MNNLHRELAPISAEAWADIEAEARRTFELHVAARRVVDVIGPAGVALAAVGTGHLRRLDTPSPGVEAGCYEVASVVQFRVPVTVQRSAVDAVARGAKDADWQPVKDAAKQLAYAEDRAIVDGFAAAGITGIRQAASNPSIALPADPREYPVVVAKALTALRLAGVAGPYSLLLSADAYTAVAETTDHGYPIRQHLARILGDDGEIIWAPAIGAGVLLSTRGGDYELHLGQDVSIGYLAHDAETVQLYFQESLTFIPQTTEAAVALT